MMDKGQMQDWIIKISLELYKLTGARFDSYARLEEINEKIKKEGISEELELEKALYLIRTEKFEEADGLIDKCLKINGKNLLTDIFWYV